MESFFVDVNFIWIVGILSSVIAGLNALAKYRYEKKLEQFRETNVNLFKQDKEVVLAAISTLSVFKRDPRFEHHTTNVLLSRLYTELDYDITNAICNALIQYSNRQELLDISAEVLDINRNFFVQTSPVNQMVSDLDRNWSDLQVSSLGDISRRKAEVALNEMETSVEVNLAEEQKKVSTEEPSKIERAMSKELQEVYLKRSLSWIPKKRYELLWHKQITADTYSRILRRAYYSRPDGWDKVRYNLLKFVNAKKRISRYKELDMRFYQNDFNYVYMADFATSSCSIVRSAISSAVLVDVNFNNISKISGTSFQGTLLFDCRFKGGVIEGGCSFRTCKFDKGSFTDIDINDVDFNETTLTHIVFQGRNEEGDRKLQITNSSFNYSLFKGCTFRNCVISLSSFCSCNFEDVTFENVVFEDTFFCDSVFTRVHFVNCEGLEAKHLYKYYSIDESSKLPNDCNMKSIAELKKEEVEQYIQVSKLNLKDKEYIRSLFSAS